MSIRGWNGGAGGVGGLCSVPVMLPASVFPVERPPVVVNSKDADRKVMFDCLPIADGQLIGVITRRDLLRATLPTAAAGIAHPFVTRAQDPITAG